MLILNANAALFTNDTLSGPIGWKVLVRPSISIALRGWIQLFVSNSRNQNILINPSQITAYAAKVVIVISEVKLLNSNINVTKITLYTKVTLITILNVMIAARGWIQLFVSNSRNQNILINPS